MAVKIQVDVFWAVKPCSVVVGYTSAWRCRQQYSLKRWNHTAKLYGITTQKISTLTHRKDWGNKDILSHPYRNPQFWGSIPNFVLGIETLLCMQAGAWFLLAPHASAFWNRLSTSHL